MSPGGSSRRWLRLASGSCGSRRSGWAPRARASASGASPIRSTRWRSPRAVVKDGVEQFPVAYLNEQAIEIRLISDHRNDLVADRTRVVNRLRWHLLVLCPELESSLKRGALTHVRVIDRVDRRLRKLPAGARVRIAREQTTQLRGLNRQIGQLHRALTAAILIGHTSGNQHSARRRASQ
jgi:hypothetical protein